MGNLLNRGRIPKQTREMKSLESLCRVNEEEEQMEE